jgi:branched-chain amino acid transport system substrate-binding protein
MLPATPHRIGKANFREAFMSRTSRWLAAGAAVAAAVSFATVASAQDTIKIGLVCAFSGQFAEAGIQMDNGLKLYMKEHGDTVAGKKIVVIRKDTGGVAPDTAKRLAQELIVRDKVDVLACFESTPNALAVADVSAQAKKFMVNMNASASFIITKSPYMIRTSFTVFQLNEALGTWAFKNGVRKAYTLVSDFSPGHDGEAAFQNAFKAAGGTIVDSARYPVANVDFSAFIQRASDSKPDGIYIWVPSGPQPAAIGKVIADRGIDKTKIRIMGQGELTDEDALKSMGEGAIGLITAAHYDYTHRSPMNEAFVRAYNAEFKHNPGIFAVGGYDGMHAIYEALKKTNGSTDADALVAAAKGMKWESPRGPVMIDPETRDIVQNVYIRHVEKIDGKVQNVEFDKLEMVKDTWKPKK